MTEMTANSDLRQSPTVVVIETCPDIDEQALIARLFDFFECFVSGQIEPLGCLLLRWQLAAAEPVGNRAQRRRGWRRIAALAVVIDVGLPDTELFVHEAGLAGTRLVAKDFCGTLEQKIGRFASEHGRILGFRMYTLGPMTVGATHSPEFSGWRAFSWLPDQTPAKLAGITIKTELSAPQRAFAGAINPMLVRNRSVSSKVL